MACLSAALPQQFMQYINMYNIHFTFIWIQANTWPHKEKTAFLSLNNLKSVSYILTENPLHKCTFAYANKLTELSFYMIN